MFDWVERIKDKTMAAFGYPPANDHPLPSSIAQFMRATKVGSPDQARMMGRLADYGVTPEHFAAICDGLARGVAYDYYRFRNAPAAIVMGDERDAPWYDIDKRTIVVPRDYIAAAAKGGLFTQSKTHPYLLQAPQMARMYGVEEGFHDWEFTQHPEHYKPLLQGYLLPEHFTGPSNDNYNNNPIEGDAKIIVQEALHDFHYDRMPIAAGSGLFHRHSRWQDFVKQSQPAASSRGH